MSKSQSKSKNPFHLLASPPMWNFQIKITRYFNLTLATHSINEKQAVLREIRSVSSPIIACHVEKSLRIE